MKFGSSKKSSYNLSELYLISKNLSEEILMEEHLQSRGIYYSALSENYFKKKSQFKRKVFLTKIFYAIIFGVLPVIPILAYIEYINILTSTNYINFLTSRQYIEYVTSSLYEFDFIIFSISLFYGIFFSLQFLNFLLMTIMETTVILSGQSLNWFKTLPLSNKALKKMMYITVFRNFDIPIIVIIFAFPVSLLFITANLLFFLITLGISIINTFLGINIVIIISKRLNRILNLNDISSKKTFFIRLFNVFSYVFIILGSIYLIQWTTTSVGEIFELFRTAELPNLINIILSTIPYPFSQSYLIALMFSPTTIGSPIFISTLIGMSLLILLFYLSFYGATRAINKVILSEPIYKHRGIFIENLKESFKIKVSSTFRAHLRKDLLSATRDLKTFLSLISPIIFSFIFVTYLNLPNLNSSESIEFQIFKVWASFLLITPILSGIIVFSLLNLDASGQIVLASLPLIQRERAKAKLFIMFVVLTLSIILPCSLYITNSRFFIFFFGIIACLPFAWIFLLLSFEMSVYFFGRRNNSYIVTDLSAKTIFIWVIVIFIPLSLCLWIVLISTIVVLNTDLPGLYFGLFISVILIATYGFTLIFYDKLFPLSKFYENIKNNEKIPNPTFFTRHIWVSITILLIFDFIFNFMNFFVSAILHDILPQPIIWLIENNVMEFFLYFAYYYVPLIISNIVFILIYLLLIPKRFGIPYGRKSMNQFLDDTGLNWIKSVYKHFRYIILGLISIIVLSFTIGLGWYPSYYINEFSYLISIINSGIWMEIIYRGILLNILKVRYKARYAVLIHLAIIFVYFYFFPGIYGILSFPASPYVDIFTILFQSLLSIAMILGYHFIMSIIFIKSKSLLPNVIIIVLFSVLFYPIGTFLYRMI